MDDVMNGWCEGGEEDQGLWDHGANSQTAHPHLRQLVHAFARIVRVHVVVLGPKMAPLEAVHRAEVHLLTVGQTNRVQVSNEMKCGGVTVGYRVETNKGSRALVPRWCDIHAVLGETFG